MPSRTALVVLIIALCAAVALGTTSRTIDGPGTGLPSTLDMEVEIVRPETVEVPGIVPVAVRLHNVGDTSALVDSLQVTISDGYYSFVTGLPYSPGVVKLEYMPINWVPDGSEETCTAWITYPEDMNHHNDTDVVIVNRGAGLSEGARTDVSKSPGWLSGSIARADCRLTLAGAARVTLFDIRGREVLKRSMGAAGAGEVSLNLRNLSAGVYLVRLDDGQRSLVQKLAVQR